MLLLGITHSLTVLKFSVQTKHAEKDGKSENYTTYLYLTSKVCNNCKTYKYFIYENSR